LIHQAVAPNELMPLVMKMAQKLSRGAPVAQAAIRSGVRQASRLAWSQGRVLEMAAAMRAMSSEDAGRGMKAYVAQIAPQIKGVDLETRSRLFDDLYEGQLTDYTGK
jgi:hypothetical protein